MELARTGHFTETVGRRKTLLVANQQTVSDQITQENGYLRLELSAHTQLILEGSVSVGVAVDRTRLAQSFLPPGELPVDVFAITPEPGSYRYDAFRSYSGALDMTVTAVPEPTGLALAAGLSGLWLTRRARRAGKAG